MYEFKYGERVNIGCGASLPKHITSGIVCGVMSIPYTMYGCLYAVDVGEIISDEYQYNVVGVFECFLEKIEE